MSALFRQTSDAPDAQSPPTELKQDAAETSVHPKAGNNSTTSSDNSLEISFESSIANGEGEKEEEEQRLYALPVDREQDDKAINLKLCSFARPHMRAFHCAWWGYFIAFCLWFAAAPLLSEIRDTLDLSNAEIWSSSIAGVGGTVFMRFALGPLCDKYGARVLMTLLLMAASIPTALTGFVETAEGLTLIRLFIGTAGGTFVMCQYWCSRMFTPNVVGTANAVAAGWGNLGAGVSQLIMGSVLFPLFKWFYSQTEEDQAMIAERAWRTVSIVPASIAFCSGIAMYFISEDSPRGNYVDLKRDGHMDEVKLGKSFCLGFRNVNTWLVFTQYACCFGVEMTMNNAVALYFKDEFGQSTESAAAIASIFGFLNLFARGLGGVFSDWGNAKAGMRGRLWVQTFVLTAEGLLIIVFANTRSLASAVVVMACFSLFVQAAEGSSYGIVPYIDPAITGSISGIVGAGGNVGAVAFSFGFRQLPYVDAFRLMGACVFGSAFLSLFIFIRHYPGLICNGRSVPEKDAQSTEYETEENSICDGIVSIPECDIEVSRDIEQQGIMNSTFAKAAHHRHVDPCSISLPDYDVELSTESHVFSEDNRERQQPRSHSHAL